jgi:hypothetical protein
MKISFTYRNALLGAFLFCSCNSQPDPGAEMREHPRHATGVLSQYVGWLTGCWANKSGKTTSYELWKKINDTLYEGKSFTIKGDDIAVDETMQLVERENDLWYIPTVKAQNNGKPVPFKLISSDNKQLVFANPEHDFPQKIAYTQISTDSLVAEISGTIGGEQHARQFPMHKVR